MESLELWYELGRLYSGAAGAAGRATRLGFTATLVSGALVLLSAPLFGTDWAGPFAPVVPPVLGLVCGFGMFGAGRLSLRRLERGLSHALRAKGLDPRRPASSGLSVYYDAQLIHLRSEYEYLISRGHGGSRSARLFEETFGFTPEDPFESGPLNVTPDTRQMRELRARWERGISRRSGAPEIGLREDLAYRVFPREMTVPAERATREAYLNISRELITSRYGREMRGIPEPLRDRAGRDLDEHDYLTRGTSSRR